MVLTKVSILLMLCIFGMIVRAWCDPVKSTHRAAVQLTTVKMEENKAALLKRTEPAEESPEWLKKVQGRLRGMNLFSPSEEKKRLQCVEPLDQVVYSREFSEQGWTSKFSRSLYLTETKLPTPDSGQPGLKAYLDETGSFEQAKTFTKLRLLQSREETFKEIFMGIGFSLDLTNGRVLLEMNVAPSTNEKRSGFSIRF